MPASGTEKVKYLRCNGFCKTRLIVEIIHNILLSQFKLKGDNRRKTTAILWSEIFCNTSTLVSFCLSAYMCVCLSVCIRLSACMCLSVDVGYVCTIHT